jgi:NADPH-ferrihemoprotein reductase
MKAHPQRVHVTSVVVDFVTPANRKHLGVCSNWLAKQIPKDGNIIIDKKKYSFLLFSSPENLPEVPVFIRRSEFHLPRDASKPIIMVGPGIHIMTSCYHFILL